VETETERPATAPAEEHRDLRTVFPSLAAQEVEAIKSAAPSAMNFVSEKELEELKAKGGLRPEDGTISVDKSLAEVLAEAKAKKEEAFQEGWRTMKQGKNKPLDEDEIEFLDQVEDEKIKLDRALKANESAEIDSFRLAVAQQAQTVVVRPQASGLLSGHKATAASGSLFAPKAKPKKLNVAVVAKRKEPEVVGELNAGHVEEHSKKPKLSQSQETAAGKEDAKLEEAPEGLGLLGMYGSDEEEEEEDADGD